MQISFLSIKERAFIKERVMTGTVIKRDAKIGTFEEENQKDASKMRATTGVVVVIASGNFIKPLKNKENVAKKPSTKEIKMLMQKLFSTRKNVAKTCL